MGIKSKIEWTDATWNPVTGCTKISEGCKNCYAERIAKRFWGDRKFSDIQCHPDRLAAPGKWRKPRKIFVCSMSDLFHDQVPFEFIYEVWAEMICHPKHTFMVLTKRPLRMLAFANWYGVNNVVADNIWVGVSAENQAMIDERIPLLLEMEASIKFVSVEPMLEEMDIDKYLNRLDWIICGCESGTGARVAKHEWIASLLHSCQEYSVPFFLKQVKSPPNGGRIIKMPEFLGRVRDQYPVDSLGGG